MLLIKFTLGVSFRAEARGSFLSSFCWNNLRCTFCFFFYERQLEEKSSIAKQYSARRDLHNSLLTLFYCAVASLTTIFKRNVYSSPLGREPWNSLTSFRSLFAVATSCVEQMCHWECAHVQRFCVQTVWIWEWERWPSLSAKRCGRGGDPPEVRCWIPKYTRCFGETSSKMNFPHITLARSAEWQIWEGGNLGQAKIQ